MAQPLETILRNKLEFTKCAKRAQRARRVVLLGVGSDLRGDDEAGMLVASRLKSCLKVVFGSTAPENMTGVVRRLKPTHLIIVDAAQMGKRAGTIEVIEPDRTEGVTFTTHQLPLNILTRYLRQEVGCEVILIGIQPKTLKFGKPVSREVKASVSKLAAMIKKILK